MPAGGGSRAESAAETRERLRSLIRRLEARPARPHAPSPPPAYRPEPVDAVFPSAVRRNTEAGSFIFIEERYALDHEVGVQPLSDLLRLSSGVLSLLCPDEGVADAALDELLFLDIETTGLGGAGAVAFLVATGRVEPREDVNAFVLRQYLATSPADEAAAIAALLEDCALRDDPVLVTYNGRVFDAPLLDERATMHRMRAGFDALRHLDLLAPVRTGLRGAMASCRLASVETEILQLTRPSSEIAGAAVPDHYFRFLRSGDARLLAPIVEHNAQDVVSLGAVAARFTALVERTVEPTALDALALGRLHAARGARDVAVECLERSVALLPAGPARDDALCRLALLYKRQRRRDLALPLWSELAANRSGPRVPFLVEIAKYLEHDCRDYVSALAVVGEALSILESLGHPAADVTWRQADLLLRRARLERRAGGQAPDRKRAKTHRA